MSEPAPSQRSLWQQLDFAQSSVMPLPLWKPSTLRSGYTAKAVPVDSSAIATAEASGLSGYHAAIASWAVLISRYLKVPNVAVGVLEKSYGPGHNSAEPLALVVPAHPDALLADVCAQVQAGLCDAVDIAQVVRLRDLPPGQQLFGTLVVSDTASPCSHDMQHHHCSLALQYAAGQDIPLIHIAYDQAVYADEAIQELAVQFSTVFAALLTTLSASSCQGSVRVKDLPWVNDGQKARLLELATVPATNKGSFPNSPGTSIQAQFSDWAWK
ncbi:hypothetical protein H4R34_005707, partial [Dimargaris verticillata]